MDSVHEYSKFYEDNFNPLSFLNLKSQFMYGGDYTNGAIQSSMTMLHEFMKTGQIQGTDLLEVGCRPSVVFSIIPSQYFKNVYLADYLECNVDTVRTWVDDKPEQVDLQPFFDFIGSHLGKGFTWPNGPAELRRKICGVWRCDVHLHDVLPPAASPRTFDCITSCFVFDSASSTEDEFNKAVLHVASLLKPGGTLITYCAFESSFCTIDDVKFPNLPITETTLVSALTKAGLDIICKQIEDFQGDKSMCDAKLYGLYVAQK